MYTLVNKCKGNKIKKKKPKEKKKIIRTDNNLLLGLEENYNSLLSRNYDLMSDRGNCKKETK
jgi:hypothetical protein